MPAPIDPRLRSILAGIGPSVVAFSGGIDSTYLLYAAHAVLGIEALAVTAISPSLPEEERRATVDLARAIGAAHRFVTTDEMEEPGYVANEGRRCYFCKRALFRALGSLEGVAAGRAILYGAIPDDFGEDRPGLLAAAEAGVRAPLVEAGLTKQMIRELARRAGLANWDKPAMACLASRLPRATPVTESALRQIDRAEQAIRRLGYRQVRVRHHGSLARIELDPGDLPRALALEARSAIHGAARDAGYLDVEIDPRGYRPGGQPAPGGVTR